VSLVIYVEGMFIYFFNFISVLLYRLGVSSWTLSLCFMVMRLSKRFAAEYTSPLGLAWVLQQDQLAGFLKLISVLETEGPACVIHTVAAKV